jgi:hypothetical protein
MSRCGVSEGRGTLVWVRYQLYKGPPQESIYLIRSLDAPPIFVASDRGYGTDHVPSFIPSKDGRTITVKSGIPDSSCPTGGFILDVEKNERRPLPADANTPSP